MDIIANGIRLRYIESGSGYPVVCIPGNGLSTEMWRHLIPELSQRYRAISYELRGMGKSEAPGRRGMTYTNEDHAKDLEAFLDALNINQAAIVAHAFGGFTKSVLTYTIYRLMKLWVFTQGGGFNYQNMSDACAAARDAENEFRRRNVDPYEDKKIQQNGAI